MADKQCKTCVWNCTVTHPYGCEHPAKADTCLGTDYGFNYSNWSETRDVCTCPTIKGPRMYDNPGFKMCQHCLDFHKKFFPAFPGQPGWRLNHGAINRNGWGILARKIKTRDIEKVSDLQLEAAQRALDNAREQLTILEVAREYGG